MINNTQMKFKIINPPIEPKKKFRRRKIYKQEISIIDCPEIGRKFQLTEIQYKNMFELKYAVI